MTIDNLLEADVVLANGERVRASADEHPDLRGRDSFAMPFVTVVVRAFEGEACAFARTWTYTFPRELV